MGTSYTNLYATLTAVRASLALQGPNAQQSLLDLAVRALPAGEVEDLVDKEKDHLVDYGYHINMAISAMEELANLQVQLGSRNTNEHDA